MRGGGLTGCVERVCAGGLIGCVYLRSAAV